MADDNFTIEDYLRVQKKMVDDLKRITDPMRPMREAIEAHKKGIDQLQESMQWNSRITELHNSIDRISESLSNAKSMAQKMNEILDNYNSIKTLVNKPEDEEVNEKYTLKDFTEKYGELPNIEEEVNSMSDKEQEEFVQILKEAEKGKNYEAIHQWVRTIGASYPMIKDGIIKLGALMEWISQ